VTKHSRRQPRHHRPADLPAGVEANPQDPPPNENVDPIPTDGPRFAETTNSPDPTKFTVMHTSDAQAYAILDSEQGTLKPRPFPVSKDAEPRMSLADAIGGQGKDFVDSIDKAGQIVFHAVGDTGNTLGPKDENMVSDKLVSDFSDTDARTVPSFLYHLGDVVYSFGEAKYYYDQFYDPYRDYPAPIFAIAGNHDGMVAPGSTTPTLEAFLQNFCDTSAGFHRTPEAGGLVRTAGKQPALYFTLEAPFVRILGLYSNCLEDPGVISTQTGSSQTYPYLTDAQLTYLEAALKRAKKEFKGALLIAVHHPPYVAPKAGKTGGGKHGGSPLMLADLDNACEVAGIWPHAVISGHAHNYQRFTRYRDNRETPYVIIGNSGHGVTRLSKKGEPTLRAPLSMTVGKDKVIFENYDDSDFGYLRLIADDAQLRIEYHPATDGAEAKTPDDAVTVDLKSYKLTHFKVR
jgi:hypothetical protein